MKLNKFLLACLVLAAIVVISETGNVMKKQSNPSRPRTGILGRGQRRGSGSRSNPNEHRLSRVDAFRRRRPAEAPVRAASPARGSPSSRSHSPGASSSRNSQSPQLQRREIPKIVNTPPRDERPRTDTVKTGQKKVTFSNPLVNIKYFNPNENRRRRPAEAPVRAASPARGSPRSRSHSLGASSRRNSQSPQLQQREIPKIVNTPPRDERPRTDTVKTGQKKVTFSNPLVNIKYFNPNENRRRRPAEAPVRAASPARGSPRSRSHSPGASSSRNSQSPQLQQREIPKIVNTPPRDERSRTDTAKTGQKKVTFSNPLVNIKYFNPNENRKRKHTDASARPASPGRNSPGSRSQSPEGSAEGGPQSPSASI